MTNWRQFLQMLREDEVYLDHIETAEVDEAGAPRIVPCLTRSHQNRLLYFPLPGTVNPDDPVGRRIRRQIANTLRLPVEKYVLPDD